MKVRIKETAVREMVQKEPSPQYVPTQQENSYRGKVGELQGKWCTVETAHLFEDQFNIVENNLRVHAENIDAIDWEDDIKSFENFKKLVRKRYKKDWPGFEPEFKEIKKVLKNSEPQKT